MSLRPTVEAFYLPGNQYEHEPHDEAAKIGRLVVETVRRPEQFAAEMVQLGMSLDEVGTYTDLDNDTIQKIFTYEQDKASKEADALDSILQHLRANGPTFKYNDIVLAGMIACEYSHWDVKRKNGKDYFTHPAAVAAIAEECWNVDPKDPESQKQLERIIFVALIHDTFEDAVPDDGTTFLKDTPIITPLLVKKIFEKYGRDDGDLAAESMLLLTKFRQRNAKTSNDEYIERVSSLPEAVFIKICDTQYNAIIDPKGLTDIEDADVEKNDRRTMKYQRNIQILLYNLNDQPFDEQISSHIVTAIDRHKFNRMSSQLMSYRPRDYAPIYDMMQVAC